MTGYATPLYVVLLLLSMLPSSAAGEKGYWKVIHRQQPPVISYVGGKHPHIAVNFAWGEYPPHEFHLRTPCGAVMVRWREDYSTEEGSPAVPAPQIDISHPDTIFHIVIVSPARLPVYFRGAGDAKWVHVNGCRLPVVKAGYPPFRMEGGLNIVAVAYPDAE